MSLCDKPLHFPHKELPLHYMCSTAVLASYIISVYKWARILRTSSSSPLTCYTFVSTIASSICFFFYPVSNHTWICNSFLALNLDTKFHMINIILQQKVIQKNKFLFPEALKTFIAERIVIINPYSNNLCVLNFKFICKIQVTSFSVNTVIYHFFIAILIHKNTGLQSLDFYV